ncbi:MAG: hypothetical protein ACK4Z5_09980 [Brevundimonas sp.]
MLVRLACAAAALTCVAGAAQAQSALQDQVVQNGRLQTTDPRYDGSYYDCYAIDARAGDTWTVTLQSEDFDSYLAIGSGSNCGSMNVFGTNDDGEGIGLDSRLSYSFDYSGRYLVRATSLGDGDTGRYTILGVRSGGPVGPNPLPTRFFLSGSDSGYLDSGDRAESGGGSYFDCYTFGGINGQAVTITHESSDFDAYLKLYEGISCDGVELATDDDSAGSLNSRLDYTFSDDGVYSVRATSLGRDTGAYTISIELR